MRIPRRIQGTTQATGSSILVAALILAGCSGDDGPAGDASTPDAELTYDSPLAAALNLGDAPDLATKQQEQVAECMAERGWDYTPIAIPGGIEDELGSLDEYSNLFDEEYRSKWGYGISTIYAADGNYVDGSPTGASLMTADPNDAYTDTLSPEEQSRYYSDLLGAGIAEELAVPADEAAPDDAGAGPTIPGDAPEGAGSGEGESSDPNVGAESDLNTGDEAPTGGDLEQLEGSCTLAGLGADSSDDLNRLEQLSAKLDKAATDLGINSTDELVEESSELQAAQGRWAECMADADYEVKTVDGPAQVLSERLDNVLFGSDEEPEPDLGGVTSVPNGDTPSDDPAGTAPEAADEDGEEADPGDSEVVAGGDEDAGAEQTTGRTQAFDPAKVDIAALKKLQADELTMAEADRDCQAEFFRPTYLEVRGDAEQRFVDRNGELLDELAQLSGLA